jgi:predicted  nucleic acid-binding Zn-ribbon protein
MDPLPESGYEARVEANLSRLERFEISTRQDIAHTQQEIVRAIADIQIEMEGLKSEIVLLEHEMKRTAATAKDVVVQFRPSAKRGEFARLQSRIDAWAPEKRITRDQFKKMLDAM